MATFSSNPPDPPYTVFGKAGILSGSDQLNQWAVPANFTSSFAGTIPALASTIPVPLSVAGGAMLDVTPATNIAFTVSSASVTSGATCLVRVNSHTTYTVDFSAFTRIGLGQYNSTGMNTINIVQFYRLGSTNFYSVASTS